ncbi:MAG TPA: 50S ribosomal protein L19 [Candidatus Fimimonas merdipullorum]|uniref:Large ribosomal subunit protein bL19 n=1 Tax=Candidatus Fimimonas merdipullorum TaxID=2840822 RepID=A0A9D1SPM1_9BACT|nr:50S ribosomal protein L19 [Candidatus Fimimonas merdipullorum]
MDIIKTIEAESLRQVAQFNIGDTVRVNFKVIEGNKERIQAYEGIVIARKHGGLRETFTVRRISSGIGVERTFPLHSPKIESIAVVRKAANVKRAKLYYLRSRTGKAAKVKGQN